MPTTITPLNQDLAYTFCTTCRDNGNPNSPLRREMHVLKCPLGHVSSMEKIQREGADMVKAVDLFQETPALTDIYWKLPVNPKVKDLIEEKFKGRVLVTIGTLLAALADGSLVMITGEDAVKLKAMGVKSGADMVSYAESVRQMEKDLAEANARLEQFQKILVAAGVS